MTFDPKQFVSGLTTRPGVYQMMNAQGQVIYVGKAKNLRKRVGSYFKQQTSIKTRSLVNKIADIQVIITETESEALVLENNLIKTHRPHYNILFRDDKSYPYIYAMTHHTYPRFAFYRGKRAQQGRYFGPYPSIYAVREILNLLQKVFKLRSCRDSFFRNRSRPCLQYQINRCTAPCVGYISEADYQRDFNNAMKFLEGEDESLIEDLQKRMEQASQQLNFETAATYRDQIANIREIQAKQYAISGYNSVDIIAYAYEAGKQCVYLLMVRDGRVLGSRSFFPKIAQEETEADVLQAFCTQYYLNQNANLPQEIVLSQGVPDRQLLSSALKQQTGQAIHITVTPRHKSTRQWLQMAQSSARQVLLNELSQKQNQAQQFQALQSLLPIDTAINRIACFDVSHSHSEATVAACVVYSPQGPEKQHYKRFNILQDTGGDDYKAMREAMKRYLKRLKSDESQLPDILLIDGGKGQVNQAESVLEALQVEGVLVLGIAKGPKRQPGMEKLILTNPSKTFFLPSDSTALHLLQQIRDEAHRFAITHNRSKVNKARQRSTLEDIEGIGAKRRKNLLKHFGGLAGIKDASVDDLLRVEGISKPLAKKIYQVFHGD